MKSEEWRGVQRGYLAKKWGFFDEKFDFNISKKKKISRKHPYVCQSKLHIDC